MTSEAKIGAINGAKIGAKIGAEIENIKPEQLIDTSENKPIEIEEGENKESPTLSKAKQIPLKNVKDLTKEERQTLINNAKNNTENDNYKVVFTKNGQPRITKKKPEKESTATKIIRENKGMTNEQLLFEHVINLESQLATLKQKHKNLKRNYKQIYQDVYIEEPEVEPEPEPEPEIEAEPNYQLNYQPKIKARGYRARLVGLG